MKNFIKKIWGWIISSNHSKHIALSALVAMFASIVYGLILPDFTITMIVSAITVLFVGAAIEIYQYFLSKVLDIKNTLGDLFADILGCAIGILVFNICLIGLPISSVVLVIAGMATIASWIFVKPEYKTKVLLGGLGMGLFGFLMFLFS